MDQQDTRSEHQWRNDVKGIVSETGSRQSPELSGVCIFRVPKFLIGINRKAYVPQVVSLGPLHWKTLSTQMHDHKAEAVRKMLRSLKGKDIDFVVGKIRQLDEEIKSCYDEVIECDEETLALMMTLDGCFLLEFFRTITRNLNPSQPGNFEPISIFAGKKIEFLRGYMVLRDIMMLENQIPLCVLVKLLQLELNSCEKKARQALCDLAYPCLMSKASPFKFPDDPETLQNLETELKPRKLMEGSKSLLDFWRLCMESFLNAGKMSPSSQLDNPIPRCPVPCGARIPRRPAAFDSPIRAIDSPLENLRAEPCSFLDNPIHVPSGESEEPQLETHPHETIPRRPVGSPPVPWEVLDNPEALVQSEPQAAFDNPIRVRCEFEDPPQELSSPRLFVRAAIDNPFHFPSGEFEGPQLENPPPPLPAPKHEPRPPGPPSRDFEALDNPIPRGASDKSIPCILPARNLKIAGIEIKACKRDKLNEIRFINKGLCGAALFLPQLLVTDTTEIVIRNLMAFEKCRASPPNPISRYIQLMDNLIDGGEDVSLLIKNGVIDNYVGSENEIAALFNSLCKGISAKHIPKFDDVLRQVKKYHDGKWNVVIAEFVQNHFSSPWVTLAFVWPILIVLMTALQTVYSVYTAYNK